MSDFNFSDHGTICLLSPLSRAARRWVHRHLPNDAQVYGGAIAISHRYADEIVSGIINDGLEITNVHGN
jgi:hypothetical protein